MGALRSRDARSEQNKQPDRLQLPGDSVCNSLFLSVFYTLPSFSSFSLLLFLHPYIFPLSGYAPPETIASQRIGYPGDVYSLGQTLYSCLAPSQLAWDQERGEYKKCLVTYSHRITSPADEENLVKYLTQCNPNITQKYLPLFSLCAEMLRFVRFFRSRAK